ncbi:hypothetical protein [[Mycobacterium] crassicus]|uniref:Uncharacterized protein n=1 Tax=[Mycobacterium] crassicus TaxID=2872309 RepID=A0ABU5XK69_9MYCO|nr:hypothetical protein [Mycolicibacter sp. MYC098]MEB3022671.1 hypothetical protein [Mycolicibacter sp. MYC098]
MAKVKTALRYLTRWWKAFDGGIKTFNKQIETVVRATVGSTVTVVLMGSAGAACSHGC